ncbi:MAG: hypothetical protein HRT88_13325 [Lentisphaeraceae bacterium]|nr:hypothetical protein [Lentisphaeraceae bacterium]
MSHSTDGKCVAIGVSVIYTWINNYCRVFICNKRVIYGAWNVIYRIDGDVNRSCRGCSITVIYSVGK